MTNEQANVFEKPVKSLQSVRYELPHNSTRSCKNSVDILWNSL